MATFAINPGSMGEKSIQAERFQLANDYWFFFDADDQVNHVITAKSVGEIERRDS